MATETQAVIPADGQALLRGLVEDPGDLCARLVFADWLEEFVNPAWATGIRRACDLTWKGRRCYPNDPAFARWLGVTSGRKWWGGFPMQLMLMGDWVQIPEKLVWSVPFVGSCVPRLEPMDFGMPWVGTFRFEFQWHSSSASVVCDTDGERSIWPRITTPRVRYLLSGFRG